MRTPFPTEPEGVRHHEKTGKALVIAQVGQVVLIEAEVVPDLVQERDDDLLVDAVVAASASPAAGGAHDPFAKEFDPVGQRPGMLDGSLGQRNACVQAAERSAASHAEFAKRLGARPILDDDRHVVEQFAHLLGQLFDRLFQHGVESVSLSVGHDDCSASRMAPTSS